MPYHNLGSSYKETFRMGRWEGIQLIHTLGDGSKYSAC